MHPQTPYAPCKSTDDGLNSSEHSRRPLQKVELQSPLRTEAPRQRSVPVSKKKRHGLALGSKFGPISCATPAVTMKVSPDRTATSRGLENWRGTVFGLLQNGRAFEDDLALRWWSALALRVMSV